MSAIFGVFGSRDPVTDAQASSVLRAMHPRGADHVELWRDRDVLLGVARFDWERDPGFSGPALIARDDRYVVAADASVCYRAQLRHELAAAGVVPLHDTAPHLVLAAFRAWGADCAGKIDGDFAFVAWDLRERVATCARDFGGKRPLHYAELGREFVVASTIGGVAAHPRCPTELNAVILAGTAAGLTFSAGPETCYHAVRVLPSAHWLRWKEGGTNGPVRFWEAPVGGETSPLPHEEAAEHLRDLLRTATRERMDPDGVNAVWMSGGWDSPSVFAAAKDAERSEGLASETRPVSISYPEGDPGREDELIRDIAGFWDTDVHWLDIAEIPLLDREPERARWRDEPYAHLYEHWNGALAAGARECGARVALDGNGGDQLFQNTDVYLADLFRGGRWVTLLREWRSRERTGSREFFASTIQPNLTPGLHRLATWLRRGRPLRHYLEGRIPEWLDPDFVEQHDLLARDRAFLTRDLPVSHAEREIEWFFSCQFFARAFSRLGTIALTRGVELRSPLSDRRVIEFALSRPWWERSSGKETKTLLRSAMKGLLPDHVLAPRSHRTGITSGYSHRWMHEVFPSLLEETLRRPFLLAELGIVRKDALRKASEDYEWIGDAFTRVNLFYTLQTELWLRGRAEPSASGFGVRDAASDRPEPTSIEGDSALPGVDLRTEGSVPVARSPEMKSRGGRLTRA